MSEPPDRRRAGTTFSISFTVANEGRSRSGRTRVRFFLVRRAGRPRRGDRRLLRAANIGSLRAGQEASRRIRVRISSRTPFRLWFLAGCAFRVGGASESVERNNCRVSGQRMRILPRTITPEPVEPPDRFRIDRTTLPIGRPTITGVIPNRPGDAEKSNQRKVIGGVGPVTVVADCKRTTNGDSAGPNVAFTNSGSFDEDGDEAKILIYTNTGTVTFNSLGASSRRNIPAGEGTSVQSDTNPSSKAQEATGGEGKHMAIAAARDPDENQPENDWVTAYKVGTVYVAHSSGIEFILTGYAAIDTFGIGDNCAFGGVIELVKV